MKPLTQTVSRTAIVNLRKWRHTPRIWETYFIMMVISFKLIYNFKKIPLKTSHACVCICMYIS